MASTGDERRDYLRKASGSWTKSNDPEMSEWGNPLEIILYVPCTEYIGAVELTRRTETS